jgi:hypothetical protein
MKRRCWRMITNGSSQTEADPLPGSVDALGSISVARRQALSAFFVLLLVTISVQAAVAQVAGDAAVQDQWFTGTLEAPSPALSKAGEIEAEPYLIFTVNSGAYGPGWEHYSVPNDASQVQSETVLKYGITNRLTIQALPAISHSWAGNSSATGFGDLPVELEYRFNDENNNTGAPSVTVSLGMVFPTGSYDHLPSASLGSGTGVYTAKQGLLLQSVFDTYDHHPVRIRVYAAAYEPLTSATLQNISEYSTAAGFRGTGRPGVSSVIGIGGGWAINQSWVLAADILEHFSNGATVDGQVPLGATIRQISASSTGLTVAPAVEYNLSANAGLIFGVAFTAAGRNTASSIAPQIALSLGF